MKTKANVLQKIVDNVKAGKVKKITPSKLLGVIGKNFPAKEEKI
jgi:hypothetical protein